MNAHTRSACRIPIVELAAVLALALSGCHRLGAERDVLYQTSTIQALIAGVYDGAMTCGELRRQGDLGIGTFNALDGELALEGGRCYQVDSSGVAREMPDSTLTPFAVATPFDPDLRFASGPVDSFEAFQALVDSKIGAGNLPCAVRVEGTFSYMKTRSVPRQKKPYRPLTEVVKEQSVFEFSDVEGVIVGFRLPQYFDGINVPGYHMHFLTADRAAGGHILDFRARDLRIDVDPSAEVRLALPTDAAFAAATLAGKNEAGVQAVETGR